MSNIIQIRRNLRAFLKNKFGGEFNNYIFKVLNFYDFGSQSGIVMKPMEFIDNQIQGARQVSVWMAFPVLSKLNERPDLEDAYEKALSLADSMALRINDYFQNCSPVGVKSSNGFSASAQVLPIENVRSVVKQTDFTATTNPTATPINVQPLTASFYALSVAEFNLDYFADED